MTSLRLQDAIRDWDREVGGEAARLIESGTPPTVACSEAIRIVSEKRRRATEAARGTPGEAR